MYLDFTDTQALAFFLACHERAFHYYGGVPEEILYDRTKTVWLRDDDRGEPVFHPGFLDFARGAVLIAHNAPYTPIRRGRGRLVRHVAGDGTMRIEDRRGGSVSTRGRC